ncbi:hypothetical protein Nepgr_022772 [Nepenthes gracilis]|uniref:Uncharacterized protein n=1 Tax=Nepenthes gracilis TaxID=150966 RepID=A0AAD3T033_NEPGR|nr:hypothetical protein Nepgr_022772 [Nepenthes gracilis]
MECPSPAPPATVGSSEVPESLPLTHNCLSSDFISSSVPPPSICDKTSPSWGTGMVGATGALSCLPHLCLLHLRPIVLILCPLRSPLWWRLSLPLPSLHLPLESLSARLFCSSPLETFSAYPACEDSLAEESKLGVDTLPIASDLPDIGLRALPANPPFPPSQSSNIAGEEFFVEVEVEYQWKPTRCNNCGKVGHNDGQCKPKMVYRPTGRILEAPPSRLGQNVPIRELAKDKQQNTKEAAPVPDRDVCQLPKDRSVDHMLDSAKHSRGQGSVLEGPPSGNDGMIQDVVKLEQFDHPSPANLTDDSCYVAAGFVGHHDRVIVGAPLVASIENKNSSFVAGAQPGEAMESSIAGRATPSHDLVEVNQAIAPLSPLP